MLNTAKIETFVEASWEKSVLKTLQDYISIPNQSPDFDPKIFENGYQEKAVNLLLGWVKSCNVKHLECEVIQDKNKTPLIFMELPASDDSIKDTVLMYGHFDKQPPLEEKDWENGLGPYKPVIRDGKLYGRGGADDGYSIFAAIDSIRALQDQNLSYPRCVIVIEGSEESGSSDLLPYLDRLKNRIGSPSVVVCLDSGCGNYEQLWLTVSLRGIIIGYLTTQILKEGIHSGNSGIARDSFHVLRMLLDKIDNVNTNEMFKALHVDIPDEHKQYAKDVAKELKDTIWQTIPFYNQAQPQIIPKDENDLTNLLLNHFWKPQLSITGIDGIPGLTGGNVLRKYTKLKLSIRVPPTLDPKKGAQDLKNILEQKPTPFNSTVTFDYGSHVGNGFVCPKFKPWLMTALQEASQSYFKKPCLFTGEGGAIPLMGQLQKQFPQAQFVITGILGPSSNAHGPNEFLHINYTKKVVCCIANILHAIGKNSK